MHHRRQEDAILVCPTGGIALRFFELESATKQLALLFIIGRYLITLLWDQGLDGAKGSSV
jgi:hypothetical protein